MGFRLQISPRTLCELVLCPLPYVLELIISRRMRFNRTMNAYTDDRPFSIDLAAAVSIL